MRTQNIKPLSQENSEAPPKESSGNKIKKVMWSKKRESKNLSAC